MTIVKDSDLEVELSPRERERNRFFRAISDPTRRAILINLSGGTRTVGQIVGKFPLSQPTISRHLSVLKDADLVTDRRVAQNVYYALTTRGREALRVIESVP